MDTGNPRISDHWTYYDLRPTLTERNEDIFLTNQIELNSSVGIHEKRLPFFYAFATLLIGNLFYTDLVPHLKIMAALILVLLAFSWISSWNRKTLTITVLLCIVAVGTITRAAHPISPVNQSSSPSLLQMTIEERFPEEMAGFTNAIILGERDSQSDEDLLKFRKIGLNHLLAVSGLHVGIIAFVLWIFFKSITKSDTTAAISAGSGIIIYIIGIGSPPSALRAGLMATAFFGSKVLGRKALSLNLLFAAGFISLLLFPSSVTKPGFQLTYAASAGIVLWARLVRTTLPDRPGVVYDLLAASFAAQITTIPLSIWHFGEFAPVSLVTNVLAIPLFTVLLVLILIALIPIKFLSTIAIIFYSSFSKMLTALSLWVSGPIELNLLSPSILCLILFLGLWPLVTANRLRMTFSCALLLVISLSGVVSPQSDGVYLIFTKYGGGAVAIRENGKYQVHSHRLSDTAVKRLLSPFPVIDSSKNRPLVYENISFTLGKKHRDGDFNVEFFRNRIDISDREGNKQIRTFRELVTDPAFTLPAPEKE
ncbi:MAG: ComEC/Rec2 family competence protein [Candidatus Lindowbacteria bacterium]|nr:ComEC/Rec2 family competence protein [Candidatus Lindowbacteria bacterium]